MRDKVVCERLSVTKWHKVVCERVVCVCDKVVYGCDKVVCDKDVYVCVREKLHVREMCVKDCVCV